MPNKAPDNSLGFHISFITDPRMKRTQAHFLETRENARGRKETRRYWTTEDITWMKSFPVWENLRSIGMVESVRVIKGVATNERRFYISSLAADAKEFARAVRGHWSIENSLHWSLDVSFGEDQCRVRSVTRRKTSLFYAI